MSYVNINAGRTFSFSRKTATAGTAITQIVPGIQSQRAKLRQLVYTAGATAHNLTVLRPLAKTTVYSVAASAATSLVLTRDPGAYAANNSSENRDVQSVADNLVAANDHLIVQLPDGAWHLLIPSAVSTDAGTGRVTLTVPALPTGGVKAGATVWFMGAITDTNPGDGAAHPILSGIASATTTYDGYPLVDSLRDGDPMLIYSGNATNAGIVERGSVAYGP